MSTIVCWETTGAGGGTRRTAGEQRNKIDLIFFNFFQVFPPTFLQELQLADFLCDYSNDYNGEVVNDDETQKEESPPNLLLHN